MMFFQIIPDNIFNGISSFSFIFDLVLVLCLCFLTFFFYLILKKFDRVSELIQNSITPKFIDTSPKSNDLFDFAIEIWRLEQKINKVLPSLPENQRKNFENSFQKLKRYLEKNDVEFIDYFNKKYGDGLNLEILSVEKDPKVNESKIKETIEPTILYRGQVVRRGKVILLSKE